MEHYHEVRQGECIASICKLYGFNSIETLYNHPRNTELKRSRLNAYILYPGDRVYIPEIELKEVAADTEQCHSFRLKTPSVYIRLKVHNLEGQPCNQKPYELRFGEEVRAGSTDPSGLIKERINADAEAAELTVWFDGADDSRFYKWKLKVGHLDPVDEITGIQARLNNLGYFCGEVNGTVGDRTATGIREFQRDHHLPETGNIDETLQSKLLELHRC